MDNDTTDDMKKKMQGEHADGMRDPAMDNESTDTATDSADKDSNEDM